MKSLLFALGLALCCFVQAEGEDTTTMSKTDMGRWITLAVACSSENQREQLRDMPVIVSYLSIPRKDVFSTTARIPMPDGCKNVTHEFRREEDGKYHDASGEVEVAVESVEELDGFVISTINASDMAGNKFRTTILHSREVTQDPEILQKFKDKCNKLGYSDDQIVVLSPTVKCP